MDRPHCLTIAGSDPGGGAGIQGDLKTFTVLGAYGMAVITALTAQNSLGVAGVHAVPPDFVRLQMRTLFDDIPVSAAKTGMLATAEIIAAVLAELPAGLPLVADPVMVSTSGSRLLEESAIDAVRRLLMPRCTIATPNAPEAEVLTGIAIHCVDDAVRAGLAIAAMGARAVLVKGGDSSIEEGRVVDVLVADGTTTVLRSPRVETPHTHGSGCALAAALCVGIARGLSVTASVDLARRFVAAGIRSARAVGGGNGPVDHLHALGPGAPEY